LIRPSPPFRIGRRLDVILSEILDTDGTTLPGIHTSVKLAHLEYDSKTPGKRPSGLPDCPFFHGIALQS
jgi:hypothetical protein